MELVRQPVFLLLMTTSAGFCIFLASVPYFAFGDDLKMVKDTTFAVTLVFGLFGAVMSASSSVAHEIRTGTALAVGDPTVSERARPAQAAVKARGNRFVILGVYRKGAVQRK